MGWSATALHGDCNGAQHPRWHRRHSRRPRLGVNNRGFGRAHRAEWQDDVGYFYLAVFVFGQWFLIGRWLDRRRGLVRFSTSRWIPRNSRIVNAVALLGSLVFTCFGIWQMRHSGWMSSWIPGAGITAWGLIAAIASTLRLR
jgi:hypothetical protein